MFNWSAELYVVVNTRQTIFLYYIYKGEIMDDLIRALTILRKYGNPNYPTHCERGELHILDISPADVTEEDKLELKMLGFKVEDGWGDAYFVSEKFGGGQ